MKLLSKEHDDLLADLLWWLEGALHADPDALPFHDGHVEAIREARIIGRRKRDPGEHWGGGFAGSDWTADDGS